MRMVIPEDPVERLRLVGKIAFGSRWQVPMAKLLGVDRTTIFRWAERPPADLDRRLSEACRQQVKAMGKVSLQLLELARRLDDGDDE